MATEPAAIGVASHNHEKLRRLKENGYFNEMVDAYRFAIGLAVAQGITPPAISSTTTVFATGTIDADGRLRSAVQALYSEAIGDGSVYKFIERLADWGIAELHLQAQNGEIEFENLLRQAEESR